MKRLLYLFACLICVSCMREEEIDGYDTVSTETVYAVISENANTKTYLGDDLNVLWSENDEIGAFMGKTLRRKYVLVPGAAGSTEGEFTRDTEYEHLGQSSALSNNVAYYPFCEPKCAASENGYTLTDMSVPTTQPFRQESFAPGVLPMLAVTKDTDDVEFHFKNLCGALKLQLKGSAAIKELKLTGNKGERLSGNATAHGFMDNQSPLLEMNDDAEQVIILDCGSGVQLNEEIATTFIFIVPPTEFEEGFTVTATSVEGTTGTLSTSKKNSVVRSHILVMPEITMDIAAANFSEGDYYDEFGINHGPGVEIDGTIWAPVNCGYHETDYKWGKLYQWGRRIGFGYNDNAEYRDATFPTAKLSGRMFVSEAESQIYDDIFFLGKNVGYSIEITWRQESTASWIHNPCPEGWTVPTYEQLMKLFKNKSVWTSNNGVTGYWFSGSQKYSEDVPRVFLPSSGQITGEGIHSERCEEGYYWNASASSDYMAFSFVTSTSDMQESGKDTYARSVRCVRSDRNNHVYTTDIVLDRSDISMENHETATLAASITYSSGSTGSSAIWTTDNHDIVSVNQKGEIKAKAEGTATITAKSGHLTASCTVKVTPRKDHEGDYIDEYGINHGPGITVGNLTFAPVPCGYHKESAPYGKTYQWGRKHGLYKSTSVKGPVDLIQYQDEENADLYFTDGLSEWRNDLWTLSYKSEYDPCPDGWIMPIHHIYNQIKSNYATFIRDGHESVWFSGDQQISEDTPCIDFDSNRNYWTCSSTSIDVANFFFIEGSYPILMETNKSSAYYVRCVKSATKTKAVTEVNITKSSLSLQTRETATLKATISPSDASHNWLAWSSDKPSVATVDANGTVTAKSAGTAVIRAMAGMKTDECVVTVTSSPYAVRYIDEYGVDHGEGLNIDGTIWAPVNCGYEVNDFPWGKLYQWGRIHGQGYSDGTYSDAILPQMDDTPLYAEEQDESNENTFITSSWWGFYLEQSYWNEGSESYPVKGQYDPCPDGWRVPTQKEFESMTATGSQMTQNDQGIKGCWFSGSRPNTESETRIFLPFAGYRSIDGTASERSISANYWTSYRLRTFYSYQGYTKYFYSYSNTYGHSVRCVQEDPDAIMIPAESMSLGVSELELAPSQSHTLAPVISPSNSTMKKIRWSTSDKYVASIDNGVITAHSEGTAIITARVGTITETCIVTVAPAYVDGYYIDDRGINHGEGINIDGKIWAPVNCGYHSSDYPNGKMYQWGRKYGQGYKTYSGGDAVHRELVEGPVTLEEGQASRNRHRFYTADAYPYLWLDVSNDKLWNSGTEEHPVKTGYDPCPKGWRVPTNTELQSLLAHSSSEVTVSGTKGKYYSGSNAYSEKVPRMFLQHPRQMWGDNAIVISLSTADSYRTSTPVSIWESNGVSLRCIKDTDELADIPVTGLTVASTAKVLKGESASLTVTVYPGNATDKSYTLTSSDESIVRIEGSKVFGVNDGEATVTVRCGSFSAQCKVTVWSLIDYVDKSGKNHGKGTYISGTAWAPVNAGTYVYMGSLDTICPDGWRVPTRNELNTLVANRSPEFSSGCYFSGNKVYSEDAPKIWLSASGRQYHGEDSDYVRTQYVGESGFYWSSDRSGYGSYVLEFNSRTANAYGALSGFEYYCSVRCVQQ